MTGDVTEEMAQTIAAMLDHPSVYMGGPSQRNMRRAEQILAAVAPLIAAQERERCAALADAVAANYHEGAQQNLQYLKNMSAAERFMHRKIGAESAAAAIRQEQGHE